MLRTRKLLLSAALVALPCLVAAAAAAGPLRINGSTTVNPVVSDAAELLRVYGIEGVGRRHNAADDARMAAELYVALAQRLAGYGRGTFGAVVHL